MSDFGAVLYLSSFADVKHCLHERILACILNTEGVCLLYEGIEWGWRLD